MTNLAKYSRSADGREIHVRFDYDKELVFAVKQVPGRRFNAEGKYWAVPVREDVLPCLRDFAAIAGEPLPQALEDLFAEQAADKSINQTMSSATAVDKVHELPQALNDTLRPFQRAGVAYIIKNRRVIVGDDMGLGKTLESLASVEAVGAYPCLIICPASLKYNWQREIVKWLPEHEGHVTILNGKDAQPEGAHFVIINYDVLKRHLWTLSIPWKAIIVDESHYIKNRKAQRTNFVLELVKDCEMTILLSGTPILNKPIELATQLQAIKRIEQPFGGFWAFAHRYCNAYKSDYGWVFDGATNLDELQEKLRQTCYIRRDKRTVLTELPDKQRQVIPVDINNRSEYERAEKELIKYIQECGRLSKKFEKELDERYASMPDGQEMTAKEIEAERAELIAEYRMDKARRAERAQVLVGIETLKQVAARGKLAMVKDWIDDFLTNSPNEKLVIFATHKDVIEAVKDICTQFYQTPLVLTGETKTEDRDRYVQLFQNDPQFRIFLSNIQAGGVGITLTAASHVLFIEYAWNAATMNQAEDRLYRMGQKNAVNVYWLSGIDTIDEMLIARIEDKRDITHEALEDEGEIQTITTWLERRIK